MNILPDAAGCFRSGACFHNQKRGRRPAPSPPLSITPVCLQARRPLWASRPPGVSAAGSGRASRSAPPGSCRGAHPPCSGASARAGSPAGACRPVWAGAPAWAYFPGAACSIQAVLRFTAVFILYFVTSEKCQIIVNFAQCDRADKIEVDVCNGDIVKLSAARHEPALNL